MEDEGDEEEGKGGWLMVVPVHWLKYSSRAQCLIIW